MSKLPTNEAVAVAQLCCLLLLKHIRELDSGSVATISQLLLALLLHHAAPVRRAAQQAAGQCLTYKPIWTGQYSLS